MVAACANRATEGTFGAAVAEVGVLDYLKFAEFTIGMISHPLSLRISLTHGCRICSLIGRAWVSDYGVARDPHDFDFMLPISPLHNVPTDKNLPPTLLLTADRTCFPYSQLFRKKS